MVVRQGLHRRLAACAEKMPREGRLPSATPLHLKFRRARPSDATRLAEMEEAIFPSDRMSRRRFAALATAAFRPHPAGLPRPRHPRIRDPPHPARHPHGAALLAGGCAGSGRPGDRPPPAGGGGGGGAAAAARFGCSWRCGPTIVSAIRLYKGAGYGLIGRRPDYYSDGMDALLYARELPPRRAAAAEAAAPHSVSERDRHG